MHNTADSGGNGASVMVGREESKESKAAREAVAACVRRLIEIGLPEAMALHARDAVRATLDNFEARKRLGEFD
jgi:hypothetical protein